jgi:hypothetical protein
MKLTYLKHLNISSTLVATTNYSYYKDNSSQKTNNYRTPNKKSQQRSNHQHQLVNFVTKLAI